MNEWILCTNRLPLCDDPVLITVYADNYCYIDVGLFSNGIWYIRDDFSMCLPLCDVVIAWMYIPVNPYIEGPM